ncbi:uncharacterized protein SPAPADRAFT_53159 [Spathaspora passalidarum NRRL Y-27907]|uniref:C2 domain-containing protein n=1 Tax=Spathaspora passalidarum (strain NRRL Y-27907 / 11-Y1) TaxID=619300 RepID=G3AEH4_SPAPN|nr:uncharacterized protein SPAPADRAFT_53159 [Spathaspora passalidarum NRRL Y-27907]EGW34736.1 hypothetical protein SPAPADRAFT_53159 [Spathaspora passalidarum NRRL Y-27907]
MLNLSPSPSPATATPADLYKYVLKVILLEYSNEARFRTPIIENNNLQPTPSKRASRLSMMNDQMLPDYAIRALKEKLKTIMTNSKIVDEQTRRSLLRLYGELLDPTQEKYLKNIDFLIPKFAASANQELKIVANYAEDDMSEIVFRQTRIFIDMLIEIVSVRRDKDASVIAKLQDTKRSFTSKKPAPSLESSVTGSVRYPQKSYRLTDLDKNYIGLLKTLFTVDDIKIQQDVFKYKDMALAKHVHKDSKEFLKCDPPMDKFPSREVMNQWKKRQESIAASLVTRYKVPAELALLPVPPIPAGEQFHILPRYGEERSCFFTLAKLLLEEQDPSDFNAAEKPFLTKAAQDLLFICARIWHIDYPTRAVALMCCGHESNVFAEDPRDLTNKKQAPISIAATMKAFQTCKKLLEEGGLDWEDKNLWLKDDQDEWAHCLGLSYSQLFVSLREALVLLFSEVTKPKFGPYLSFLDEYIESDSLFPIVSESGLPKKWEKRLTKALLKIAGTRYGEYLANLPRDDTLSVIHVLNICDMIVDDIKKLQKRYKAPLLGFLNVAHTVAAITTGMFASDVRVILTHIKGYAEKRKERIPFADALEVYKTLSEIRDIHNQVTPAGSKFEFDLEQFFFPYLEAWIEESDEKILAIITEALKNDNYEPIDLSDDDKKNSNSILDIFTIIKQYLNALRGQHWSNEFQLSKVYTILLRSISNGALYYADQVTNKILQELEPPKLEKEDTPDIGRNWLDEVKNVVSNIQNLKKPEPQVVYNFEPQTCIALNNLSAMMQNLAKLEEWLDPESISNSLSTYDPNSKNRYLSHVFTLRIVRAENLKVARESSNKINPYVSLVDFNAKRLIGKTRTITQSSDPEWDEEFEITIPANTSFELSALVWDEKFGQHLLCGKAYLELNPRKFKHNGMPEEIILDLDLQGKLVIEVAVESETLDAIFVMGRAYRALKRCQERAIKIMVEKFSGFIHACFSRANLKSICSKGQPSKEDSEAAIEHLCDYLNMNLCVLKEFLKDEIFMKVMVATWNVVVTSADELVLPKLSKASVTLESGGNSWQAVSSKFANVSLGILGIDSPLSDIELETVLFWLSLLVSFFHNEGNGPPMEDLKTEQYQSLLLIPALYDQGDDYLIDEVERLSPAYVQMLNNRNNFDSAPTHTNRQKSRIRSGSLLRNKTISANATARSRAQAAVEVKEARADPITNQTLKEDMILRLLIARGRKNFVSQRLNQRSKLAYSMATERIARAAVERRFN